MVNLYLTIAHPFRLLLVAVTPAYAALADFVFAAAVLAAIVCGKTLVAWLRVAAVVPIAVEVGASWRLQVKASPILQAV